MTITENIIESYLNCRYKSYLKLSLQIGERHLLQEKYDNDISDYICKFQKLLINNKKSILVFDNESNHIEIVKSKACEYFFNTYLKIDEHEITAIIKKSTDNNEVKFSPVLIVGEHKIKDKHKILLAYYSHVLQILFSTTTDYGEIIYNKTITIKKISLKRFAPKIIPLLNEIRKVFENNEQYFLLNKHCKICEYNKICKQKAIELDHLSLITTIKEKDIQQLNLKGIFTVNQLSYTFKPRRKPKRQKNKIQRHFIALKALAIRKGTVYIYNSTIELENVSTKIYLDVEGYGEDIKFYYLIGVLIENEGNLIKKSYWISFREESKEVYKRFVNDLESFCKVDFILFHYGTYDVEFLKDISNYMDTSEEKISLQKFVSNSIDALPFFLFKLYFPTFSNDLKSISNYIGFNWTSKNASGLDAIVWRQCWEHEQNIEWKNKLITYNSEDCFALKLVVDFIYSISADNHKQIYKNVNISTDFTEEIRQRYGGTNFGNSNYILEDFSFINKRAYFDYQRDKVFIRTNKRKLFNPGKPRKRFTNKPNQIIILKDLEPCIFCGSLKTTISKTQTERVIIDIKKSKNGLRKWVIKYVAHQIHCKDCNKRFNPSAYKEIGKRYGFNLVIWIIYQHIANNTSFEKIGKTLEDLFQISIGGIGSRSLHDFKEIAAEYYKVTYQKLIDSIGQWHILHADETRLRLRTSNGYIWVLTNLETVVFKFRSDRTCGFLEKITENFKGVFISDFYKGYEFLKCRQQKCLVHLLRDVNDLLFKEQQNDEVKVIANKFGSLLRKIVSTIDKYGLKKRNLNKHLKDVESFYKEINLIEYKSKNGRALFERFTKSQKNLFTFLSCDNVPWNNNNAEHSFKHFAVYRRQANGLFTEKSIEEYLILLSIYQTCKYRGINFLKFLLSKEIDIDEYFNKYTNNGTKRRNKSNSSG